MVILTTNLQKIMYDVLIKKATVVDGTGQASFVADVGISGDKIVDIAPTIPVKARSVVEAEGFVLAPGFVDVQNHSDTYWNLFDNPSLDSLLLQGFTSILVGNCGSSLAPLLSAEALRASQKWHDISGSNINWTSFADYVQTMGKSAFGCNVGSLVGYSTLRRGLIGDARRTLQTDEAQVLETALVKSLESGAFGLSTGLAYAHESHVSELELYELAKIVKKYDALLSVHLRTEGAGIAESVEEALEIGQRSGVRFKLSHFKVRGAAHWSALPEILQRLELAAHQGLDVSFDVYPYDTIWQPLYTYLPKWATSAGRLEMLQLLSDPVQYRKVVSSLHEISEQIKNLVIASASYKILATSKHLGELAMKLNLSSEEALVELLRNGGAEILVFDTCLNSDQVEQLLAHPMSVVASDGGGFPIQHGTHHPDKLVHPRCFGTAARFLNTMRHNKRMGLEECVAKLTSLPARVWGLANRGQIAIGHFADLVLFDPLWLTDKATITNPYRVSTGVHAVWVNGRLAVQEGMVQKPLAGQFLRRS